MHTVWHGLRQAGGYALRIVLPKRRKGTGKKALTSYRRADADGWAEAQSKLDPQPREEERRGERGGERESRDKRRRQRQMRLVGSGIAEIITIFIINCGKSGALAL